MIPPQKCYCPICKCITNRTDRDYGDIEAHYYACDNCHSVFTVLRLGRPLVAERIREDEDRAIFETALNTPSLPPDSVYPRRRITAGPGREVQPEFDNLSVATASLPMTVELVKRLLKARM